MLINTPTYISAYADSRIGGRSENQDSFGWADTKYGFLILVCDGMGGGPGGKTASTIAVSQIIDYVSNYEGDASKEEILSAAVHRANDAIVEEGMLNPSLKGMGSTAVVLLVDREVATIAFVGDSRIYQLRDGKKVFRTFDHSMVFELVKKKVITEEQARLSTQSNIVTRALGMGPNLEVETHTLDYKVGDRFVLCSDGIHGTFGEPRIIEMFSMQKESLDTVVYETALNVDSEGRRQGGGHDNLTLAMVRIEEKSLRQQRAEQKRKKTLAWAIPAAIAVCAAIVYLICRLTGC